MKRITVLVLVFLIVAIVALAFILWIWFRSKLNDSRKEQFDDRMQVAIPKRIWTYWHDANEIPPIVSRCIDTWRRHNPDYEITVLNERLVAELCGGFSISSLNVPADFHQRRSDYARILVVMTYGGVWMDSTLICTQSLQWLQDLSPYDLLGYYAPSNLTTSNEFPILENWFFAAPAESPFVRDWWDEVMFMNSFPTETDYVNFIKDQNTYDLQQIETQLPYLVMHLCAMVVQQRNPSKYNLVLMDSEKGPYEYLIQNDWQHWPAFEALCRDPALNRSPILKVRGNERRFLEQNGMKIPCAPTDFNADVYNVVSS